ncbi:MAG: glycosyltransferase family 4 protein [Methylococcaceae bacterium]
MDLFFSFAVSVLVSIALIPVLMRYAGFLHMVDEPGDRKVHTIAIPRCGGFGLAVGAITSILLFVQVEPKLIGLIVGSISIVLFGLLDDLYELNYKWKFVGQFLAVSGVIFGGIYISFVPFAGLEPGTIYITLPLTVLFFVGVTNAVNLADGLDGLAAGIMLMTFAAIAFLAIDVGGMVVAIMALAVSGGIVGFLWFNTHPAVVFMGDTGSQFIGFMAVILSVYLTQDINRALNPALPLLLLGLPILDTLSVMVRRIRAGRSPFSADKTHVHHRLMEYGFSHAEAVGAIYLLQGLFLAFALRFRYASDFVVIGTYMLVSASILLFFYWASETQWRLHAVKEGGDRRGNRIWRNKKLFHFCRHYINYSLAIFLLVQLVCLQDRFVAMSNELYLIMISSLLFYFLLPKVVQDVWVRFSIYIAAIFASVMAQEFPEMVSYTHWSVDIFLLALIVMVSIAIRITRKSKFRVTTQDVLVALFVIASVLLIDIEFIEHVTFRLFCLVYALEYLLHRDIYQFTLSRYLAAISGISIMTVVIPTLF